MGTSFISTMTNQTSHDKRLERAAEKRKLGRYPNFR